MYNHITTANKNHQRQHNRRQEIVRAYAVTPTKNNREKWHYKSQCPKANNSAYERAYLLRDKNAHQDSNVATGAGHQKPSTISISSSEMQEL
ncbi:hypothetical protein Tco_0271121 [Tanacetum coccineum]